MIDTFLDQGVDCYEDRVEAEVSRWIVFVYDAIKDTSLKLYKSVQKVLSLMHEDNMISINKLAQTLNMSETGIKKIIKELKKDGLLEREGFKGGHWRVKESYDAR